LPDTEGKHEFVPKDTQDAAEAAAKVGLYFTIILLSTVEIPQVHLQSLERGS